MHHANSSDKEIMALMTEKMNLGKTGEFPQGKLTQKDEGEIKIAIGSHNNKVIINFGKDISWIGFDKQQAIDIGLLLIKHANTL